MSTPKKLAWLELTLAEGRLSYAAVVIALKVAFDGKPPTDAELDEFRDATEALMRAHREYSKTVKNEAGKKTKGIYERTI